jgi:hypothetical protein
VEHRLTWQAYCTQASFFTTIDGFLFRLVSDGDNGGLANKLALSSLTGALIFHAAAGKTIIILLKVYGNSLTVTN